MNIFATSVSGARTMVAVVVEGGRGKEERDGINRYGMIRTKQTAAVACVWSEWCVICSACFAALLSRAGLNGGFG